MDDSGADTIGGRAQPDAKTALYDAAVRLFARYGYAGTGVREVAREAGVNIASVSYFYGSKMGLLRAILEDYFTGLRAVFEANITGDAPVEQRLRRTIAAAARYMAAERDKMLIGLTELPHDDPEITELKAGWAMRLGGMLQRYVIDTLPEAERARLPVGVIAPAITTLVASHFLFRPVLERAQAPGFEAADPERYPELIADLFLDGFNGLRRSGGTK